MKSTRYAIAAALPVLLATSLHARTPMDQGASPVRQETNFTMSFSPEADWDGEDDHGNIEIIQYNLSHLLRKPLTDETSLIGGVFANYTDIDISGPAALPDGLLNVGIMLGASKDLTDTFGEGWSARAMLRPGFASDSSSISGSDFNLQGSLIFVCERSPGLTWEFGLAGSMEGDIPVLPRIGVKWSFASDWTLTVGIPETGVAYQMSPAIKLRAGAHFDGGNYHVDSEPASGSDDTWLEYSEIRVGLGVDYEISDGFVLSVDGGTVVDRSFDYFNEDYEIEGDTAAYLSVGLRARF